eukprot:3709637-Rhodomonas_salina.1
MISSLFGLPDQHTTGIRLRWSPARTMMTMMTTKLHTILNADSHGAAEQQYIAPCNCVSDRAHRELRPASKLLPRDCPASPPVCRRVSLSPSFTPLPPSLCVSLTLPASRRLTVKLLRDAATGKASPLQFAQRPSRVPSF